MNKWLKRGALTLAGVVGTIAVALLAAQPLAERRMQRVLDVKVQPLVYRDDLPAVERGRYLYNSRGCAECHGADGAGRVFVDAPDGLKLKGPNISSGPGNVVAGYKPEDWVRTLRHGVKPDGRPALIMPSEDYARFTDTDLAALVAYVRQLPPVAGEAAIVKLPLVPKALYAAGLIPDAYEKIAHSLPPPQPVPESVTLAHGAYVASMCIGCHGAKLSGGKIPGGPPDWPEAANLTPGAGSGMTLYATAQQFTQMLREGKRPDGSAVSPVMPFGALKELNDTDAAALHLYLQSLAPLPAGGR
ncbi:MAG: cytochrome c [Burkholderiaceae bacterium]|nr:cytochrome c [Burkholderiaceae bacterium]